MLKKWFPSAPKAFNLRNTVLLHVIPLSRPFKTTSLINLGGKILCTLTAPPVLSIVFRL